MAIPAAVLLALWLVSQGRVSRAVLWLAGLVLTILCIGVLKLSAMLCDLDPGVLRSPSGHAALSTYVFVGAASLLGRGHAGRLRLGLTAGAIMLVLLVAVTRVELGAHTAAELAVGVIGALPGLGLAVLPRAGRGPEQAGRGVRTLLAVAFCAAALTIYFQHGRAVTLEPEFITIAARLRVTLGLCPALADPRARPAPRGST